jgi:hypothetical protein
MRNRTLMAPLVRGHMGDVQQSATASARDCSASQRERVRNAVSARSNLVQHLRFLCLSSVHAVLARLVYILPQDSRRADEFE